MPHVGQQQVLVIQSVQINTTGRFGIYNQPSILIIITTKGVYVQLFAVSSGEYGATDDVTVTELPRLP